ncbi:glycosyltransferase family 4 protein [Thalassospiraceae bacterium LMO-JJ14]|nr:glycosyltransferase family 4 protein [Thalassospiraceae bacterium LMO-JJ14]
MLTKRIGISWQLTDLHGWGVFGLNLANQLILNGPVPPLLLSEPYIKSISPELNQRLEPFFKEQATLLAQIDAANRQATLNEVLVLHSLGNSFIHSPISDKVLGHNNIGFVFFESIQMDPLAMDRARRYDKIIAGSSWNRDAIRDMGFANADFVSQGVDLERFQPREKLGTLGDVFTVFSGGKLELRKGQDIVLAAFKEFHARHPDSILLTNWHNPWAETAKNMRFSPHDVSEPDIDANGIIDFKTWVAKAGLPPEAHMDVGIVPNSHIPTIMTEADVALFPNRCEGGTNLVAMETMASGIPCILSANTGHLDIINADNCYALRSQQPSPAGIDPTGIWGESDIDEILECLEKAYTDREDAKARAKAGVETMQKLSWKNQTALLVDAIQEYM